MKLLVTYFLLAISLKKSSCGIPLLVITCIKMFVLDQTYDSRTFLENQLKVLKLLEHISQPSCHEEIIKTAANFKLQEHESEFNSPEVLTSFMFYYDCTKLEKGKPFSIYSKKYRPLAISLFNLFLGAKTFGTFYETSAWARENINEQIFLYAFSIAILQREDCKDIVLPPIYEVYPFHFYNSKAIHKAQKYKQIYGSNSSEAFFSEYNGQDANLNPIQTAVSYYYEDVGINAFYYYYNLQFPYWLDYNRAKIKNIRRGEQFYFLHQQLVARAFLEHLSNGLNEINVVNLEIPIGNGYYSNLAFENGVEFPSRPNEADLKEALKNYGTRGFEKGLFSYSYLQASSLLDGLSQQLRTVLTLGRNSTAYRIDGTNIFASIIEGQPVDPSFSLSLDILEYTKHLLGYSYDQLKTDLRPSVLELYETALRDPVFYELFSLLTQYVKFYKIVFPPYSKTDLEFDGVEVVSLDFSRLQTFFECVDADFSNAVYVSPEECKQDSVQLTVRQRRLNHKPFNYTLIIDSKKETKAVIRIYLGPETNSFGIKYDLDESRLNFVLFDYFEQNLSVGENKLMQVVDNRFYSEDLVSFRHLKKTVQEALLGKAEFNFKPKYGFIGFPERYRLPKGGNKKFKFYVIVSPVKPSEDSSSQTGDYDGYPMGFPFDRQIICEEFFKSLPNSMFKSEVIYHN